MRILIDTNILFFRENDSKLASNLEELISILEVLKAKILIHPMSFERIKNDLNESRKKKAFLKINTDLQLEYVPNPEYDPFFLNIMGCPSNNNDYIDLVILFSVYKDTVDFLISENEQLKQKSEILGIKERVLYINEAVEIFGKNIFNEKVRGPPAIKDQFVSELNVNDSFFDSLKNDYKEFEEWIKKISREGRRCWVYFNENGSIGALLIYKIENEPINSNPPLPAKRRLKISTFKVAHTGYKIGELFIKLSSELSIKNNFTEIYLTYFTKPNDYLINLIKEYGFCSVARNRRGEDIYLKKLAIDKENMKILPPAEIAKKFYPIFYDGIKVKKFIIPIKPEYHQRLFTENKVRPQANLFEHLGEFIIEGNTIKKAHLIHFKNKNILPGDILLFYRTTDLKEITSLGVVENVLFDLNNPADIMKNVGKRGAYEITKIEKKPVMVIFFTWHLHLAKPLKLIDLNEMHIFPNLSQIPHEKYLMIKRKGGIDERFTVH